MTAEEKAEVPKSSKTVQKKEQDRSPAEMQGTLHSPVPDRSELTLISVDLACYIRRWLIDTVLKIT